MFIQLPSLQFIQNTTNFIKTSLVDVYFQTPTYTPRSGLLQTESYENF